MAAYAALISLLNTMEQIQNHPRHSFSLNKEQMKSLQKKASFLQDFIEGYSHGDSKEAELLERQIASAAHTAEDVIESHLVNQILPGSTSHGETSSISLSDLKKVIKDLDSIKKKAIKVQKRERQNSMYLLSGLKKVIQGMDSIKEKVMRSAEKRGFEEQYSTYSLPATCSRPYTTDTNTMVGFDDQMIQLMDELTGQRSRRQIISIVGMGGIGKTTLVKNVYENLLIVQHFDIRAWVVISQEYSVREILLQLLSCQKSQENSERMVQKTEDQLGEQLYKSLSGMRYLIVLDDIWSIEVWDKIKYFFPDNCIESRIVVTTRLSNVATYVGSWCLAMNFLDEDRSWNLLCKKTFALDGCPPELEQIGRKIAKNCKGLPLSIVVIGGLLGKSSMTQEYWEYVAKDINSILDSEAEELCLNILSLSYRHLPAHLKPCFLYMGIFPEDHEIIVSRLIKLWVGEGFLKPYKDQSFEEVAESYLNDLIRRNVISVCRLASNGKIRTCKIHDLLRVLCLRISGKEQFFCVIKDKQNIPTGIDLERHIVLDESMKGNYSQVSALRSALLARSLKSNYSIPLLLYKLPLLRVLNVVDIFYNPKEVFVRQVNLRCIALKSNQMSELPASISLLWNVQTVIIRGSMTCTFAPSEIWRMPQLRHLEFDKLELPEPSRDLQEVFVLRNLQTLVNLIDFSCTEEVIKRIPNLKKLHLEFNDFSGSSLYNLGCFQKLESLNLLFYEPPDRDDLLQNIRFPSSLKKLSLTHCMIRWEDLTIIGSLPHLEVLKLERGSVIGDEWSPVEGQFLGLKYLKIYHSDLIYWNADDTRFPVLQNLVLDQMSKLEEIPSGMGDIATLRRIHLLYCRDSAAISAMKILEEQESLGNEGLEVRVEFWNKLYLRSFREKMEMERLTSNNFQLEVSFPKPRTRKIDHPRTKNAELLRRLKQSEGRDAH